MTRIMEIKQNVDDYKDTIYAIIGFMNLYRFDDETKSFRKDILLFQGSKLFIKDGKNSVSDKQNHDEDYVTPDIGIVKSDEGIIGEVKGSFPREKGYWKDDFDQLMKYDQELSGWPVESENLTVNNIILLTHLTRSAAVKEYYEQNPEIKFLKPFAILEYNRISQAKEFFFIRLQHGEISDATLKERLKEGIPIPMNIFIHEYSRFKIYDSKPPLPYLLEIIWTNLVTLKASANQRFASLRKNQKIDVEYELNELTDLLSKQFSFFQLANINTDLLDYFLKQPKFPKHGWVIEACEKLVKSGDAEWKDETKQVVIFYFKKIHDILEYFIKICATDMSDSQLALFNNETQE